MKLPIYCIVGDRPVKGIGTPGGGMDVLAFDWQSGGFVRDMAHLHTLVHPTDEDAEFVDEAIFEARVSALRGERGHIATADEHIFLRHHDLYDRLLVLDPVTGDYREVYRHQKPASALLWTGFYVVVGEEAIGVFATAAGPIFFRNEARTRLTRGNTKASIEKTPGDDTRTFHLEVDGQQIARIPYPAPPAAVDPYADDDDTMPDFFAWLTRCLATGGLYNAYAVDGAQARWEEPART
jgi:hypothetical protein